MKDETKKTDWGVVGAHGCAPLDNRAITGEGVQPCAPFMLKAVKGELVHSGFFLFSFLLNIQKINL